MSRLTVVFDDLPMAHLGGVFHVLRLEQPDVQLDWRAVGFPTRQRSLLDGADVGVFVAPPDEAGLSSLALERSPMVVLMAAGHRLARHHELCVADILDEPFPADHNHHPEWRAFWTLDDRRGAPPPVAGEGVATADQGLEVVASGRAIATFPGSTASGLPHPGVVAIALRDGPWVETRLVWRSDDNRPAVSCLVALAREMTGADSNGGRSRLSA